MPMNPKPIDCAALSFIVTKLEPAAVWENDSNGRRRQTDEQLRDNNTGMPMWYVHVSSEGIDPDDYGLDATFRVEISSAETPDVRRGQDVTFDRLRCRTWRSDDGRSGESYRAKGVRTVPSAHEAAPVNGHARTAANA